MALAYAYRMDASQQPDYAQRSPDYALSATDGHIIPALTRLRAAGKQNRDMRVEELAGRVIQTSIEPGHCMAFLGNHSQVGIGLSHRLSVTAVSIDNPDASILIDADAAPRNFSVWAVYKTLPKLDGHPNLLAQSHLRPWLHSNVDPAGFKLLKMGNFEHKSPFPRPVQTFYLENVWSMEKLAVSAILFSFSGNWGNPAFTCVYRVRVHGQKRAREPL